jgi:hypothetical protein
MWEFKHNFRCIHDSKRKGCQLQCCINFRYLQVLFWSLFHPRYLITTTHSLVTIEHMDSFSINFYEILWNEYISIKTILNKKNCELQSCITFWDQQLFILVVFSSKILLYYYTLTYDFSIWTLAQGWMWTMFQWWHRHMEASGVVISHSGHKTRYPNPKPKISEPGSEIPEPALTDV